MVSIPFIAGQWSLRAGDGGAADRLAACLNPLHCGAVVASDRVDRGAGHSRRVSIPFIAGQWSLPRPGRGCWPRSWCLNPLHCGAVVASKTLVGALRRALSCLNPLHCGAVVASGAGPYGGRRRKRVSIPFIAGQWSLLGDRAHDHPELDVSIPFIAGQWSLHEKTLVGALRRALVSIPFIAGQWSLRAAETTLTADAYGSQSPSLRGSGRFALLKRLRHIVSQESQSPSLRGSGRFVNALRRALPSLDPSQSPSLRGSGRFERRAGRDRRRGGGLNPLHCGAVVASCRGAGGRRDRRTRLNPLHCGAVVASRGELAATADEAARLNPLHCGAVVASEARCDAVARADEVSIPFIAGQWSLLPKRKNGRGRKRRSQSPSLRGSGRFRKGCGPTTQAGSCLNPLHCGAVVASWGATWPAPVHRDVSIPFIAGQWSLHNKGTSRASDDELSQSPSLRGSGRFRRGRLRRRRPSRKSQSPSLRGSGRFPSPPCGCDGGSAVSQSPSLRGSGRFPRTRRRCGRRSRASQSPSLRGSGRFVTPRRWRRWSTSSLNPLHCGAVVASFAHRRLLPRSRDVSIPFIAGQWSLPPTLR